MTQRAAQSYEEDDAFEVEVISVARALFAADRPFQGAGYIDALERDGVFIGDDTVILVEATTSRSLAKAQKDGAKLKAACEAMASKHRFKAIKGYFVTRDEPTPDQRRFIDGLHAPVVACSLSQLRSMLVDSREYLNLRRDYPFGSARNPVTGSVTELDKYIPITLLAIRESGPGSSYDVGDLVGRAQSGEATLLLGDFGAGKSMTLREVHKSLAAAHLKDSSLPFPVTLNLREHQGQKDPDEAIRRHAASLGFESPARLVRAWRAGNVHILLDGFDEIATTGWLGKAANLSKIRRGSVELVRKFVEFTPQSSGLLISGRRHFFDSQDEMFSSLGLRHRSVEVAATDEFTDEQVRDYLETHGWMGSLPGWLPSHPLLLGYLSTAGALQALTAEQVASPDTGWDMLLDRICERESQIESGLDGSTIRHVLERLATIARTRTDGIGPIYQNDLTVAFEQIAGYPPDEGSYVVLQRMPGLGVQDSAEGSRFFIDASLADAARAGDVVRYVSSGGVDGALDGIRGAAVTLGRLGIGVASTVGLREGLVPAQVNSSARRLQQHGASDAVVFDLVRLAVHLGSSKPDSFTFRELEVDQFSFDDATDDLGSLTFLNCLIEKLDLTEYDGESSLPFFENCSFGVVEGAGTVDALPIGHFSQCSFDSFDPSSRTTRGILGMPGLSPKQKVLFTVLKKTYVQAGSGRKENALHRGLDDRLRQLVPEILDYLIAEDLLVKGRVGGSVLYFPVRGHAVRVKKIMESGAATTDRVVMGCK